MASEYKQPNLFYKNLDSNYKDLFDSIQYEADYYYNTIHKVIKNLNTSKYGLEWSKVENFAYRIYIPSIILIFKPKFELILDYNVLIFGSKDEFDLKYFTMDWEPFNSDDFKFYLNNIYIQTDIQYSLNQELRYKGEKLDWTFQGGFDKERLDEIQNNEGKKIGIVAIQDRSNHLEVQLKSWVRERTILRYSDGSSVDFKLKRVNPFHSEYKDDLGEIPINQIEKDKGKYFIHSSREIEGELEDIDNSIKINYKEIKNEKDEIWIELINRDLSDDSISPGTSLVELFIELLTSAEFQEISDRTNFKRDDMIKVFKVNFEEYTLLVDRLPKGKFIYPPKSDSQLKKQKWALQILKDYPSPYHRGLLKLFEKENHVTWSEVDINKSVNWKFLVPTNGHLREGTDDQRDFVIKALNTPDYAILEGPPGSGKTTALTELIYQLTVQNKRILLSASTHVAIDNVIEKLIEFFGSAELLLENGIVPLRIGNEKNLDTSILPFQIDNRKEKLRDKLENQSQFKAIFNNEEEINTYLTDLVMMSSNLVCGTTIGILRYPNFQSSKDSGYVEPEFDYMIIDEASKTTVQQFLVPAINAKRWIIAGDIKQLSPYMESLHIRVSLEGMLGKPIETALLLYFVFIFDQANQRIYEGNLPRYVVPVDTNAIREFLTIITKDLKSRGKDRRIRKQYDAIHKMQIGVISSQKIRIDGIAKKNVEYLNVDQIKKNFDSTFKLLNYDLILVSNSDFNEIKTFIPASQMILSNEFSDNMLQHLFKHEFWYFANKRPYYLSKGWDKETNYEKIKDSLIHSISRNWSGQLSWRLSRVYELEEVMEDSNAKKYYLSSMHALIPQGENHHRVWIDIQRMGQIFFPSILKCLQEGIKGEYKITENNTIISNGMDPQAFNKRHNLLRFQHRMHDEIANIPRKLFYTNRITGDQALLTSKGIDRKWLNNVHPVEGLNDKRFAWIHVKGSDMRNRNDVEAKIIIDYLSILSKWVEKYSKEQVWNVAIITYYNKQRDVIANHIKRHFPRVNQRAKVHFKVGNLKIMVYTVDKIQGREADFVLISMVRNSKLGFMDSPNRLNVGITRARYLQIVFGNADYFYGSDSKELREFVLKIENNEALFIRDTRNRLIDYKVLKTKSYNKKPRKRSSNDRNRRYRN